MNKKTEEVQEIAVLTPEQIKSLPKEVKENVVFLTERIGATDLAVLNPMVSKLIEIRNNGKALVFAGTNDDGNFSKTNIQEFVDVKKEVRTFRARVKEVAKEMKIEPAKISKAIIAIEKTFIAEATTVYDNAEKLFKPYLDAEEEKARLKQEAKDKALLEQVEVSRLAEEEAKKKIEITQVYNRIKYELIAEKITNETSNVVVNGNENSLLDVEKELNETSWSDLCFGVNISVLDEEVVAELRETYNKSKANALALIQNSLKAIALEKDKIANEATIDAIQTTPQPVQPVQPVTPGIPLPPQPVANVEEFKSKITGELERLLSLVDKYIIENPTSYPKLRDLKVELDNLTSEYFTKN